MRQLSSVALIELVEGRYSELLTLCNELEHIADGLPNDVDKQACLRLGHAATAVVTSVHELEEGLLFPALVQRWPNIGELPSTVERLRREHRGDEYYAEEVEDALIAFAEGRRLMSPDAIGYLLRGFFEGQRRHIALGRELMRPLLSDVAAMP